MNRGGIKSARVSPGGGVEQGEMAMANESSGESQWESSICMSPSGRWDGDSSGVTPSTNVIQTRRVNVRIGNFGIPKVGCLRKRPTCHRIPIVRCVPPRRGRRNGGVRCSKLRQVRARSGVEISTEGWQNLKG